MMGKGLFVTGTDTGCGKTEISLALMQLLQSEGQEVLGMKPVASGAEMTPEGFRNEDALRLQAQASDQVSYEAINPYCFELPIAPHLAARQAGKDIDLKLIKSSYQMLVSRTDFVMVEGVGGWRVPLNERQGVSDLAQLLGLSVVLVVGLRLGCINHALLTVESILSSGLELLGWVANQVEPDMLLRDENLETLKGLIDAPCLGVVPFMEKPSAEEVAEYLALPLPE